MLKRVFKLLHPILAQYYRFQTAKKRIYKYRGIKVIVNPGVFHPKFTFSTKFFIEHIQGLNLRGKKVLELGCGSGLISLHAAAKGAEVTATDINPQALSGLKESMTLNGLTVQTLHSDLFKKVSPELFDYIFINPPYYPKAPTSVAESAWFCGQDFEYFDQLFSQLSDSKGITLMILSEDCEIEKIRQIASHAGFEFKEVAQKRILTEQNWIFQLMKSSNIR